MKRTIAGVSVGWVGLSLISDGVPSLLLPHQLLQAGATEASQLGVITLAALALAALVQPLAGSARDRIGRWPVIAAGIALAVGGLDRAPVQADEVAHDGEAEARGGRARRAPPARPHKSDGK